MAVVGVDIGDYSTHISVAKLGAVETIANDYSLRATPSIVAFGERQRFLGVAAENQRNLNPKNTVSFFKNSLGRTYSDIEAIATRFGAKVSRDAKGKLSFEVLNHKFSPEQTLAMLMTKVADLVAASSDGEERLETLVVSVPIYFTQAQRLAVKDAIEIAGLKVDEIINDTSALALSYGKSKDLSSSSEEQPRHVVIIDIGSEGTQAVVAAFSRENAKILASSFNHTGGRVLDDILVEHAVQLIAEKYKKNIDKSNLKVRNKLRTNMEKVKKQMSANTNAIPVQIDSLIDDTDIQLSLDRAKFEELIKTQVTEIRSTLENLLDSTTIKPADIHSVEIVGGTSRIPIIKQTIKELFGVSPSTTLNADEAVSRGCALHAATLSSKFLTKKYNVTDCVHHGVEAVFVHGGEHEKVIVCDEGDSVDAEKRIEITADLPLNIALQYFETTAAAEQDKLVSLYKVDRTEATTGVFNLKFGFNNYGVLELKECVLVSEEQHKRRRRSGSAEPQGASPEMAPCRTVLDFTLSIPEPVSNLAELVKTEAVWVALDAAEVERQEEKNRLEETLYQARHQVTDQSAAASVNQEEVYVNLIAYFDEIETWLYEEGEDAPATSYLEVAATLRSKMKVYSVWLDKLQQMKAKEEERATFLANQKSAAAAAAGSRQIPVVYEGDAQYVPKMRQTQPFPSRFAQRRDPFQGGFAGRGDPFNMFGW